MARVSLIPQKAMNTVVSHIEGVKVSVYGEAVEIAAKAESTLLRHRDYTNETDHEVTTTRGDVDSFVNLEGPAPGAVEFGHWSSPKNARPRWVRGLYIISGAAGLTG
ncbi:Uncharacterised protein [Nocardia farcinica]|uniref:DUF5403 family protein n=1 Tax=Nocardia farcinica TaxID=37329 RepID=UPI000E071817|nr:DUF5403 family protein [Nocardia farcinica]SUE29605.1 Uncharacterised protein [Nocardia farcinica]